MRFKSDCIKRSEGKCRVECKFLFFPRSFCRMKLRIFSLECIVEKCIKIKHPIYGYYVYEWIEVDFADDEDKYVDDTISWYNKWFGDTE